MNAKEVIRNGISTSEYIVQTYLGDLSDSDLLLRPVEGMNHIAWQLGHLITSERMFIEGIKPGSCPPLPAGFEEAHKNENSRSADTSKFMKKGQYLDLWNKQRKASLAVLDGMSEADLDAPGPEAFRSFAPTNGAIMNMLGMHPMMHLGQWVAVRRKLNKPVSI